MARTAQISKEKRQSHHYFKTWSVNPKILIAKTIKCYDETDSHEDCHRNGRPRVTSAAEDKFIRVTSQK
jgi:hypothetical protein